MGGGALKTRHWGNIGSHAAGGRSGNTMSRLLCLSAWRPLVTLTRADLVEAAAKTNWKGLQRVRGENSESMPVHRGVIKEEREMRG